MIDIIPAIDLIGGQCVRLEKGDYAKQTTYNSNPVEVAQEFEAAGIKRLHLVDLDGAKAGKVINLQVLKNIAKATNLIIDFSGGIKTEADIESCLTAGASLLSIGSAAIKQKTDFEKWAHKYADHLILSADVRDKKVAIAGWLEDTNVTIFDLIKEKLELGVKKVICTDINRDGLLEGPAFHLYNEILEEFPTLELIASGGVSCIEDVADLNKGTNCSGVIIGKAIYEGKIKLEQFNEYL